MQEMLWGGVDQSVSWTENLVTGTQMKMDGVSAGWNELGRHTGNLLDVLFIWCYISEDTLSLA